jgi:hypothetical protein
MFSPFLIVEEKSPPARTVEICASAFAKRFYLNHLGRDRQMVSCIVRTGRDFVINPLVLVFCSLQAQLGLKYELIAHRKID